LAFRRRKPSLSTLSTGRAQIKLTDALADPPRPALHPNMAAVFQQKATGLAAGLEHDEKRDAARMALRGFLERSVSLLFQSDGPVP
jgi:hypothetical protein